VKSFSIDTPSLLVPLHIAGFSDRGRRAQKKAASHKDKSSWYAPVDPYTEGMSKSTPRGGGLVKSGLSHYHRRHGEACVNRIRARMPIVKGVSHSWNTNPKIRRTIESL
jgi:hypothetical protein